MPPETIAILLFDGVEELDAMGPKEVLGAAGHFGAEWSVDLVTVEPLDEITATYGTRIGSDGVLDPDEVDLLVVPGGGWNTREAAGAWAEAQRGVVPDAIRTAADAGATVATVCTGAMLAAEAGITDGRRAITHHGAVDDLRERGAEVVEARVVDDGDLVTAGGVTAGIDLGLWLVERELGEATAADLSDFLEYERHGEVDLPPDAA